MTLDQYTIAELPLILEPKIENRSYLTIIDVPKVINNNRYDFNGSLARNITFTTDEDDITAGVHVIHQNIQILSINKDKAYTISYSGIVSRNTTSYMYDDYLQAAEKIIRSIKLP